MRGLDQWAMASRLSYFLWNSMPDDELFALAAKGNTPDYVALVLGRLDALVRGCGWQILSDLSGSQADEWLARQLTARGLGRGRS